jgi:hypothetical protein
MLLVAGLFGWLTRSLAVFITALVTMVATAVDADWAALLHVGHFGRIAMGPPRQSRG